MLRARQPKGRPLPGSHCLTEVVFTAAEARLVVEAGGFVAGNYMLRAQYSVPAPGICEEVPATQVIKYRVSSFGSTLLDASRAASFLLNVESKQQLSRSSYASI